MNTSFFDDKEDGQLITQIRHHEWQDLMAMTFDESIDPVALLTAKSKKDRVLGRKLVCLMQLASRDIAAFLLLPRVAWSTLYFRKQGLNEIAVEMLVQQ